MRNMLLKKLPMIQENRSRKNTSRNLQFIPHPPAQPKWLSDLLKSFSPERSHNRPLLRTAGKLVLIPALDLFCFSQPSLLCTLPPVLTLQHLFQKPFSDKFSCLPQVISVTSQDEQKRTGAAGKVQWLPLPICLLENKQVFPAFIKYGSWALKLKG